MKKLSSRLPSAKRQKLVHGQFLNVPDSQLERCSNLPSEYAPDKVDAEKMTSDLSDIRISQELSDDLSYRMQTVKPG